MVLTTRLGGQSVEQAKAFGDLLIAALLALTLVYMGACLGVQIPFGPTRHHVQRTLGALGCVLDALHDRHETIGQ